MIRHIEVVFTWEAEDNAVPDWMQQTETLLEEAIITIVIPALKRALKGKIRNMHVRIVPFHLYDEAEEEG